MKYIFHHFPKRHFLVYHVKFLGVYTPENSHMSPKKGSQDSKQSYNRSAGELGSLPSVQGGPLLVMNRVKTPIDNGFSQELLYTPCK